MTDINDPLGTPWPASASLSPREDSFTNTLDMAATAQQQTPMVRRPRLLAPQDAIDEFWAKFTSKTPGKATTVIPQNHHTQKIAARNRQSCPSTTARASYDDAAVMCRAKVDKIVKECRRINKKYRDPHFDLESDLKLGHRDCLESLSNINIKDSKPFGSDFRPQSAKRVAEIFDKPCFYIDGPTANDVRQGNDGDCWLMAALCTLSNRKGLIEKLCVAHDQDVGVYGFVFHRDGEWISEIVDDFLYLTKSDYEESHLNRVLFDELERINPEEAYRKIYQSNSSALYFAQCQHPYETWLPLLEKCYAKAHGDYASIEGGFGGEGIEDLTGGVTSELFTSDILDKDDFWKNLLHVNDEFLFGCSADVWGLGRGETAGILDRHAYSIQKAVEIEGYRLLRLKNPWGKMEWKGPWSDGSKEWTPEWLQKLDHKFGDDGEFWIAYEDLLRKFQAFDRTRLFDEDWQVAQIWTTLSVPWTLDYHDTHFAFSITKSGPVVIVLSQLDDRYFHGLEGQYRFELAFRLHKAGHEDYVVRSQTPYRMRRSVNVDLDLDKGEYEVMVKISAVRREVFLPVEKVIRNNVKERRDKLIRVGLAYDLAHSKGEFIESAEEKLVREKRLQKEEERKRQQAKDKLLSSREDAHYLRTKKLQRDSKKLAKKKSKQKQTRFTDTAVSAPGKSLQVSAAISAWDDGTSETRRLHLSESPDAISNGPGSFLPVSDRIIPNAVNGHNDHSEDDLESAGALSSLSERELNMQVDAMLDHSGRETQKDTPESPIEEPDEFEKDPWNAAVVIGLRVYHRTPKGDDDTDVVQLKVVRPDLLDSDSNDDEKKCAERKTTALDVDDSAKDATMEGGVKDRKKSILGDALRASQ